MAARSERGRLAPHIEVIRSICSTVWTGMMPGRTGTAIPAARARSRKEK